MENQKSSSKQNSNLGIERCRALGNQMSPTENCIENKINSNNSSAPTMYQALAMISTEMRIIVYYYGDRELAWQLAYSHRHQKCEIMSTADSVFLPSPHTPHMRVAQWLGSVSLCSPPNPRPAVSSLRCLLREQEGGSHDIVSPGLVLRAPGLTAAEVQPEYTADVFVLFSRY